MSNIAIADRVNWLGASEVAALFDLSPYSTQFELWHQKRGTLPGHDLDNVERIMAGQYLEPSIAAWAAAKWDWVVTGVPEYLTNPNIPKMGASLDFETEDGEPVEIKNVDWMIFRDGDWVYDGDDIYDCPPHFLLQVQHQLSCRPNATHAWLIVCVGGNRLHRMHIPRHNALIAEIETRVNDFWSSVDRGVAPDPNYQRDGPAITQLYTGENEVMDLRHDTEAFEAAQAYYEAAAQVRVAETKKKAAMAQLKVLAADSKTTLIDEGFTLKSSYIKGCVSEKKPYWRFTLNKKKEQ